MTNKGLLAVPALLLSGLFATAAVAQQATPAALPDAPLPNYQGAGNSVRSPAPFTPQKKNPFAPAAVKPSSGEGIRGLLPGKEMKGAYDYYDRNQVIDDPLYDFAAQQKLGKKGRFSLIFGVPNEAFFDSRTITARFIVDRMEPPGTPYWEKQPLINQLAGTTGAYQYNPRTTGFAGGIKFTFDRKP